MTTPDITTVVTRGGPDASLPVGDSASHLPLILLVLILWPVAGLAVCLLVTALKALIRR